VCSLCPRARRTARESRAVVIGCNCKGSGVAYKVTLSNGAVKTVKTYAEVAALLKQHGGTYKVVNG
jgi:hypothetical protein